MLTPSPIKVGNIWSGLYLVDPLPPFEPSKHLGVWEIQIQDEKGNKAVAKTHKLVDGSHNLFPSKTMNREKIKERVCETKGIDRQVAI